MVRGRGASARVAAYPARTATMRFLPPAAVVFLLAGGCITPRAFPPPEIPSQARLLNVEPAPQEASSVVPASASSAGKLGRSPRDVLVLTGGGMYGAYSAGVLNGWTASGGRPTFDVVTGVSTGALVGVYAFLGPEWDERLKASYTTVGAEDIYVKRYLATAVLRDALADSTPLQRRIEREVTPEVLRLVAQAHGEGRRFYVGTTNLDTKRLVVWDMGAIASRDDEGRLPLFREVILASCSVPGLLPPVPIDIEVDGKRHTELHVDGGVTSSAFLRPEMLGSNLGDSPDEIAPTIHVLVAGRLRTPAGLPVKRRLLDLSGESLRAAFQARWEGDLLRLSVVGRDRGAEVRVAAVADDLPVTGDEMTFDVAEMRKLFDHGAEAAASEWAWRPLTVESLAEGRDPPRAGDRFAVEGVVRQ